jgi:signal transduction histidine kinase
MLLNQKDLQKYLDHAPVMMGVYDIQTGHYSFVSKEVENILGFEQKDIIQGGLEFVWSLIHPEDVDRINHEYQRAMEFIQQNGVDPRTYWQEFEYRLKGANEKYRWVKTRGRAFSLCDNGNVKEIVDMTTLISLDQRAPKEIPNRADFETIAELAGQISHELNNPLQSMSLLMELMLKQEMKKEKNHVENGCGCSTHLKAMDDIFGKISSLRENLYRLSLKK